MIRGAYNSQLQPPAPFILVTLSGAFGGPKLADIPAQLDTAADRTLVPLSVVQSLNLQPVDDLLVGGVGGIRHRMSLYLVSLAIHTLSPVTIFVLAHPDEHWILIGRDVLNGHRLLLDGPGLVLELG